MIRDAAPRDYSAIRAIISHAFGRRDEADLAECLRASGDVLAELVAGEELALWGHALYSRLRIDRGHAMIEAAALAPVSVLPAFQRRGIGAALIEAGNASCRAQDCAAILVLGNPGYYSRFGFSARAAEALKAPFSGPSFMALELAPGSLAAGGRVRYAAAFGLDR